MSKRGGRRSEIRRMARDNGREYVTAEGAKFPESQLVDLPGLHKALEKRRNKKRRGRRSRKANR